METAFHASLLLLTILYTVLLMSYARVFTRGPEGVGRGARAILVATIVASLASIVMRSAMVRACPLGAWEEFTSFITLSICITYLILEVRIRERSTGVFAITPAFVLQFISTVGIMGRDTVPPTTLGVVGSIHILAAIVAFSAVSLCGVYGTLYLFLYLAIKRGTFGLFFKRMPPLETLSNLNGGAAFVSFLGLTVTLALGYSGYSEAASEAEAVSIVSPALVMTALMWLVYGGSVVAWRFFGLGGKRLAYTTLVGFVLLLGVLTLGLFTEGFHG